MPTSLKGSNSDNKALLFGKRANQFFENTNHLNLPNVDEQGRIVTLNKTGYMKVNLDHISQAFINSSEKSEHPVLEIGSAYGAASIEVLNNGCTTIANDIELNHLLLLRHRVNPKEHSNLYLNNQYFPSETNFPSHSIQNILCCRVAHFLSPKEMDIALDKMFDWLIPGGKLYFVVVSPYHNRLSWFLPTYQKRLAKGERWPGVVDDLEKSWPDLIENIPKKILVVDEKAIIPALEKRGFIIETCELFDYGIISNDQSRHGGEYLGVIAKKAPRSSLES